MTGGTSQQTRTSVRLPGMRLGLTALALTAALALAGCSGDDEPDAAPSATPTEKPELITYAGGESPGVEVQGTADEQRLEGAPESFQRFIGETAQSLADASTCEDGYVGVTVAVLRTDGFALGGVNDCGGYAALWAEVDGEWQEVDGTQEAWECSVLEEYAVPSDVVGTTCYDDDADKERTYQQA